MPIGCFVTVSDATARRSPYHADGIFLIDMNAHAIPPQWMTRCCGAGCVGDCRACGRRYHGARSDYARIDKHFCVLRSCYAGPDRQYRCVRSRYAGIDKQYRRVRSHYAGADCQYRALRSDYAGGDSHYFGVGVTTRASTCTSTRRVVATPDSIVAIAHSTSTIWRRDPGSRGGVAAVAAQSIAAPGSIECLRRGIGLPRRWVRVCCAVCAQRSSGR